MIHKLDPGKVQMGYLTILDLMEQWELSRGETVCAMMMLLGTEYNGACIPAEQMNQYIDAVSGFLNDYFSKGGI